MTAKIAPCIDSQAADILAIINDAARTYHGHVPDDCLHEPYMSRAALEKEIAAGVRFWGWAEHGELLGVMGIQDMQDVTLIRHAYVSSRSRRQGVGGKLLAHLMSLASRPVLVGTWRAATWAIDFYARNGFSLVDDAEKDRLLKKYWTVSARQIETSVVLADARWRDSSAPPSSPCSGG